MQYGITPATQQRWHSCLYSSKAGTSFSNPGGMHGWVHLVGCTVFLDGWAVQTPLCLAVIANSPSLVRQLISVGSDANFQLQRSQLNNIVCYRLIHCVAKKGLKWSHTLDALLDAPGIDLNIVDSEGCWKYFWVTFIYFVYNDVDNGRTDNITTRRASRNSKA